MGLPKAHTLQWVVSFFEGLNFTNDQHPRDYKLLISKRVYEKRFHLFCYSLLERRQFHTLIQIFRILHKMAPSILVMLLVILDTISIVCMFHKCELIMADNRYISEDPYYGITCLHHCILLVA